MQIRGQRYMGREREGMIAKVARQVFERTEWRWAKRLGWNRLRAKGGLIKQGQLVYIVPSVHEEEYVMGVDPAGDAGDYSVYGIAVRDGDFTDVLIHGVVQGRCMPMPVYRDNERE